MSRSLIRSRKEKGVSSVEYIIILVLVALTGIAVFKIFGQQVKSKMNTANSTMQSDVTPQ